MNWAIVNGLHQTGVTLFELGNGVDDGPIYDQRVIDISERETIKDLASKVRNASLDLVNENLPRIEHGELHPRPQSGSPSYGLQRTPADGRIL